MVPREVPRLRRLPFEQLHAVYVVPPDCRTGLNRLDGRGQLPAAERQQRLREALGSLADGLADDAFQFIINDDLPAATANLEKVASDGGYDDTLQRTARNVGFSLLSELRRELGGPRPL